MQNTPSLGIHFTQKKDFIIMSGVMDEIASYTPLLTMISPLKLSLRYVRHINSLGVRKWLNFIQEWGDLELELHDCPSAFIEVVNMIPNVVSQSGCTKRIKSLALNFECPECLDCLHQVSIKTSAISFENDHIKMPKAKCPECGVIMTLATDPDDLLFFLRCPI